MNKIVGVHFNIKPFASIETDIILREDGSFIIAYCDRQIFETGNYRLQGGRLELYNTYNFALRKPEANRSFFYDTIACQILYVQPDYLPNGPRDSTYLFSVLERADKNCQPIRSEQLTKDSLIRFNEYWPKAKQLGWLDSALK